MRCRLRHRLDFDLGGDLEPGPYIVDVVIRADGRTLRRRTTLTVLQD